jgi:hypothetical protein
MADGLMLSATEPRFDQVCDNKVGGRLEDVV